MSCDDGRKAEGSHTLLCIGSMPNSEGLGLEAAGVKTDGGYVVIDHNCRSSVPHIYAAGDLSGSLSLSSVASMQGRKIAEHAMGLHSGPHRHLDYDKAASAIFTDPEIADVGLAEAYVVRERSEGPGHEGAVLGVGQGADQRRRTGVREDRAPILPRASSSAGRSWAVTPPS